MNKLKKKRLSAGLSQAQLASETGISLSVLQSYEQGKRNINKASAEAVMKICEVLGCLPQDIMEV